MLCVLWVSMLFFTILKVSLFSKYSIEKNKTSNYKWFPLHSTFGNKITQPFRADLVTSHFIYLVNKPVFIGTHPFKSQYHGERKKIRVFKNKPNMWAFPNNHNVKKASWGSIPVYFHGYLTFFNISISGDIFQPKASGCCSIRWR